MQGWADFLSGGEGAESLGRLRCRKINQETKEQKMPLGIFRESFLSKLAKYCSANVQEEILETKEKNYLIALETTVVRAHTGPRILLISQLDWKIM